MAHTKPRLFSFGRETELANLAAWVADPDQRDVLVDVVDAFIEVSRTRRVTDETLEPIVRASCHPAETVRALAITRLVVMAHYFEEALQALVQVAGHTNPQVRLFATSSLANAPEAGQDQLLPGLLVDPDWQVRKAAAQVCGSTGRLDALRARLPNESDARVRIALELALKTL